MLLRIKRPPEIADIRRGPRMRADGVKPLAHDKPDPNDNDDLDQGLDDTAIPADRDIQEGDEDGDDESDLPPAMPPGA